MGGMIGMRIAIHRPDRLDKLILANTSPKIGSPEIWNDRIEAVLKNGMEAVVAQVRSRWFTPGFQDRHGQVVRRAEEMLTKVDPQGYAHCCEAIRDCDLRSGLRQISVNTLVISGKQDPVISPEQSEAMAAAISGSKHLSLPVAHISNIEAAQSFTGAVLELIG
jgi:pimeloyl-ACP methyl ester carboxylesterase